MGAKKRKGDSPRELKMKTVQELFNEVVESVRAAGIDFEIGKCNYSDGTSSFIELADNNIKIIKTKYCLDEYEGYVIRVRVVNRCNGTAENQSVRISVESVNGCCGHTEYSAKIYNRFSDKKAQKMIADTIQKYKEFTNQN